MASFVKICPKCGHANPEYENACTVCSYFIGMETPVAANAVPAKSAQSRADEHARAKDAQSANASSIPQQSAVDTSPDNAASATPARRFAARPSLYLQASGSEQVFEICDGWVVGQAHPTSTAQLQLRDLPSITYVHRQHCQFSLREATWHITALDQSPRGRDFTNPTLVNQTKLAPGDTHPLRNGDQLSLAGVKLVVRII